MTVEPEPTPKPGAPDLGGALGARIRARVAGAGERLAALTTRLVRIDSQTPPSATGPIAQEIAAMLRESPALAARLEARILPSDPPVVNLVARIEGGAPGRRLVLNGHLDTYPIGAAAAWREDPFGGALRDGRLYGRGAADMKGGIAALIVLLEAYAAESEPWPGELVLALAGDEESMGVLGSQRLLETVPETRGDGVLIPDVGAPQIPRCGEKGMIWLDLAASGAAAHGAHTHRGENAILRLMAGIEALRTLERRAVATPSEVAETIAAAAPLSEPLGGVGETEILQRISVNVGRIEGGVSANLVPDHAAAALDIRLPLGAGVAEIEAEIESLLAPLPGLASSVTRRYEPNWTSPTHPLVQDVTAAAVAVRHAPAAPNMRVGASDARLFRAAGLPTVVCGLTPFNLGAPDEHLRAAELTEIAETYALASAAFLLRAA